MNKHVEEIYSQIKVLSDKDVDNLYQLLYDVKIKRNRDKFELKNKILKILNNKKMKENKIGSSNVWKIFEIYKKL